VKDDKGQFKHTTAAPTGPSYYEGDAGYNAGTYNCADHVEDMLDAAVWGVVWNTDVYPASVFADLEKNKKGLQERMDSYGRSLKAQAEKKAAEEQERMEKSQ
jgi:hypothetical protein